MDDKLQNKLEYLTQAILDESRTETERILDEVRQKREAARDASKAALKLEIAQYKKNVLTAMRHNQSRRITLCMAENRRELFKLRDEYSKKVFELLHEKISAFTETPEYLEKLKEYLRRALCEVGDCRAPIVLLRKADMKYEDELKAYAPGYALSFEESAFELGGLMVSCHANNISIDMTYDTEIKDLGGHFAEMFGLELE